MDPITHTLIATGCMLGAFFLGKMITVKSVSTYLITSMLDKLELDGFIITETDKDGEKELVTVSEVIANSVREAKSYNV